MELTYKQRIGARIRAARERQRLTRAELAERVGVSGPAVTWWEQGKQAPKTDTLPAVARALRIPLEYLLTEDDQPPAPAETLEQVIHAARVAGAAVMALSPDRVEVVIRVKG
jgi:transcriptional regulator with XRE-family HTH domain